MNMKEIVSFNLFKVLKLILILILLVFLNSSNIIDDLTTNILSVQGKYEETLKTKDDIKYNNKLNLWNEKNLKLNEQLNKINDNITNCQYGIDLKCLDSDDKNKRMEYLNEKLDILEKKLKDLNDTKPKKTENSENSVYFN